MPGCLMLCPVGCDDTISRVSRRLSCTLYLDGERNGRAEREIVI